MAMIPALMERTDSSLAQPYFRVSPLNELVRSKPADVMSLYSRQLEAV